MTQGLSGAGGAMWRGTQAKWRGLCVCGEEHMDRAGSSDCCSRRTLMISARCLEVRMLYVCICGKATKRHTGREFDASAALRVETSLADGSTLLLTLRNFLPTPKTQPTQTSPQPTPTHPSHPQPRPLPLLRPLPLNQRWAGARRRCKLRAGHGGQPGGGERGLA